LLEQTGPVISDGDWPRLQSLLASIRGAPNNARENLYSAASLLPEPKKAAAQKLALQEVEYLTDMDYNTFFDSLPGTKVRRVQGGAAVCVTIRGAAWGRGGWCCLIPHCTRRTITAHSPLVARLFAPANTHCTLGFGTVTGFCKDHVILLSLLDVYLPVGLEALPLPAANRARLPCTPAEPLSNLLVSPSGAACVLSFLVLCCRTYPLPCKPSL
jgi:hypothetical protein